MRVNLAAVTVNGVVHPSQARDGTDGIAPVRASSPVKAITLRDDAVDNGSCRAGTHRLLDHDELFLVTVGHGTIDVDFIGYSCRPGTLIRARPGQVIRPGGQTGLDATILRWDPALIAGTDPFGPAHWQLAGEDEDAIINEVSQLVVDCRRPRGGPLVDELLRNQLAVLLLRIEMLPACGAPAPWPERGTFWRFRQEVERWYARTRRVEDYAERMDCAVRTVTRASLTATGRTAKQVIDDRVALQAMRLLAATDLPVAGVGHVLGFAEPTNFGRFFQREVGRSPGAFRADLREPSATRQPGRQPT